MGRDWINDEEFILICVDPGEDTGVSILTVLPGQVPGSDIEILKEVRQTQLATVRYRMRTSTGKESPVITVSQWRHAAITDWGLSPDRVIVICEDFHLDSGRPNVNTTALNIIGGFEHEPYPVTFQNRSVMKTSVTDTVLKRLDLMVTPKTPNRHINDATRHGVAWLRERNHRWTLMNGWPDD